MNYSIIKDGLITGSIGALVSYLVSIGKKNPYYLNIFAFVYAAPAIFFYMIIIASRNGKNAVRSFCLHAIFGTLVTIGLITMTFFLYRLNHYTLSISNLLFFILITWLYIKKEIYKL